MKKLTAIISLSTLCACSTIQSNRTISSDSKCTNIQETVNHVNESSWTFAGKICGDYLPSDQNAFSKKSQNPQSTEITGGFANSLNFITSVGTFQNTVDQQQIEQLVLKFKSQISDSLIKHLKIAIVDKDTYEIAQTFLNLGGKFSAQTEGGRYTANPLLIKIGNGEDLDDLEVTRTIFHELLHFAFDKMDSEIYEVKSSGGADHMFINAIEQRFAIITLLKNKLWPINDFIFPYYQFLVECSEEPLISEFFDKKDTLEISKKINNKNYYSNLVKSSMITILSVNAYFKANTSQTAYTYSDEMVQDLAYHYAQNAAIYISALKIGIYVSKKYPQTDLDKIFALDETQNLVKVFLNKFFTSQINPYENKPEETSRKILSDLLK